MFKHLHRTVASRTNVVNCTQYFFEYGQFKYAKKYIIVAFFTWHCPYINYKRFEFETVFLERLNVNLKPKFWGIPCSQSPRFYPKLLNTSQVGIIDPNFINATRYWLDATFIQTKILLIVVTGNFLYDYLIKSLKNFKIKLKLWFRLSLEKTPRIEEWF